jgi:transposase
MTPSLPPSGVRLPQTHPRDKMAQCVRFLMLGWRPEAISKEIFIPVRTIRYWESNLLRYGSSLPPRNRTFGRPRKLTRADEDALFNILAIDGWMMHDEMAFWLSVERGVFVSRSTICRVLKRNKWTQKNIARLSLSRSEALRKAYIEEMKKYTADDLVFLDEAIFNEKTGWRHCGYGPQGERIQYVANTTRGDTYAVLAATTFDGWLPCSVLKKGYYNKDQFYQFITEFLIPCLKETYGDTGKVIIMDNVQIHCDEAI